MEILPQCSVVSQSINSSGECWSHLKWRHAKTALVWNPDQFRITIYPQLESERASDFTSTLADQSSSQPGTQLCGVSVYLNGPCDNVRIPFLSVPLAVSAHAKNAFWTKLYCCLVTWWLYQKRYQVHWLALRDTCNCKKYENAKGNYTSSKKNVWKKNYFWESLLF